MLDSSAIITTSFFPPINACARNDWDYYCDPYTYVKALDIV